MYGVLNVTSCLSAASITLSQRSISCCQLDQEHIQALPFSDMKIEYSRFDYAARKGPCLPATAGKCFRYGILLVPTCTYPDWEEDAVESLSNRFAVLYGYSLLHPDMCERHVSLVACASGSQSARRMHVFEF